MKQVQTFYKDFQSQDWQGNLSSGGITDLLNRGRVGVGLLGDLGSRQNVQFF